MLAFILAAALAQQAPASRPEVVYEIAFPNALHHEAKVTVTYSGLPARPLELRMSRSSPGRYALHEFARNVYSVSAQDRGGRALPITRPNEHQWNVSGHNGYVRVSYTLFGDRIDGTYNGIDNTHAHLNMPATFMFARGTLGWPIRVRFVLPAGSNWRISTQLATTSDPTVFTAPNFPYFADSPTEVGSFTERHWSVADRGVDKTIRIALHQRGSEAQADSFANGVQRIVREERAIYGELPQYDYGTYTFIADYLPWANGDGMEHRNSTILTSSRSLATSLVPLLGTVAHEYFHSWNVERIRPKTLEPFDFERANMSGELWLAEGFTQYYGQLVLKRSGLSSLADFARITGFNVATVLTAPGRGFFSPVEMSMQAPFVDAAAAIDPNNRANTFISYYTYGAALALALDLRLRTEKDLTLDDFMRVMWRRYGRTEVPYTLTDWRATLGQLVRDSKWVDDFFNRHISGKEPIDYATLLARAGLLLRQANTGSPTLGRMQFEPAADSAHVALASGTLIGSPLYQAGLDRGDIIVALDEKPVASEADIAAIVSAHRPGERLAITFEQRGQRQSGFVTLVESDALEVVTYEQAGMTPTAAMLKLRDEWLSSKVK